MVKHAETDPTNPNPIASLIVTAYTAAIFKALPREKALEIQKLAGAACLHFAEKFGLADEMQAHAEWEEQNFQVNKSIASARKGAS